MTREILDRAFGPTLLKILRDYGKRRSSHYSESESSSFQLRPSGPALAEEKSEEHTKEIDALAGTDEVGGKLQVCLSCFVFHLDCLLFAHRLAFLFFASLLHPHSLHLRPCLVP